MRDTMTAQLVTDALRMAIWRRGKPDAVLHNSHGIKHLQQLVLGEFWAHDAGLKSVKVEIEV